MYIYIHLQHVYIYTKVASTQQLLAAILYICTVYYIHCTCQFTVQIQSRLNLCSLRILL